MLRVRVEIFTGGNDLGSPVLAEAVIARVSRGPDADYEVRLYEGSLDEVAIGIVREYPRFAASIWDLVSRCITTALVGEEALPPRPGALMVPVRVSSDKRLYVRIADIPPPARVYFQQHIFCSACPVVEEESNPRGCAYAVDWLSFIRGGKW